MRKTYITPGIDTAIKILRPGAKYAIDHGTMKWRDPRPCPTTDEVQEVIYKLKEFEDSIECIELDDEERT